MTTCRGTTLSGGLSKEFWYLGRINASLRRHMTFSFRVRATHLYPYTCKWYVYLSYIQLQSWPKLCGALLQNAMPRTSTFFTRKKKRSLGQILPPPFPHAMLFVRKGLPKRRPTLHRREGVGGGGGGGANVAGIRHKRAKCPTRFGQDCKFKACQGNATGNELEVDKETDKKRMVRNTVDANFILILSLPGVINFHLQPHQKCNITQYEELGFSYLTQMKGDCTANSHYIIQSLLFRRLGVCTFWTWEG